MLNDFTWNMTGYIPKHHVNPHGDGIIPYVQSASSNWNRSRQRWAV